MRAEEFRHRRAMRRDLAIHAAQALREGDLVPALGCLRGWRFAAHPALASALLRHMAHAPLHPDPVLLAASLGPMDEDAMDLTILPERVWRRELEQRKGITLHADPLAWALEHLGWLGMEQQRLERDAWATYHYQANPKEDAIAGTLWVAWFSGDLGRVWRGWERTYWEAARVCLYRALQARRVPVEERPRIVAETQEAFFSLFLGARGGPQGWQELAVRVLEGSGNAGPVEALAHLVEPDRWGDFFVCASQRQPWRGTLNRVLPEGFGGDWGPLGVRQEPARLEAMLDLHVAWRLVRSWSQPGACGVDASWHVLEHHRYRVRGRLRALVRERSDERLRDALLGLDGLDDRTRRAVASFIWTWAQQELSVRFAVVPRVLTPICVVPEIRPPRTARPQTPEIWEVERGWLLLCLLKGQGARIRLYSRHQDHANGSLGELLNLLPDEAADPDRQARRSWEGLRSSLRAHLPEWEGQLAPVLRQVAALNPRDRDIKRQIRALLSPVWHPMIAWPRGGYPGMVRAARVWLEANP